MNLVLYRKYRPQSFSELVGQEHVVQTITNALSSNTTSHAYLFSGPRGSGKTTMARLLAKSVNCQNRKENQFEPCNKCSSCLEIKAGRSLDFVEIDAASHRGIDEIRELREGIKFAPTKEKYKIFILDEAHQLTKEAVNALLKILEEPPSHAIFILATTEIYKMLPTIISRCQRFDFRKLTLDEITKRLQFISEKEKVKIDKSALQMIALNSSGAIRDAESLLDQVFAFGSSLNQGGIIQAEDIKELLGIADTNLISQFVDFLVDKNPNQAINFLNEAFEKGNDPQEFSKSLINYLRQALLAKINPDPMNPVILGLTKEEQEKLKIQSDKFENLELQKIINIFMDAENKIKYSSIPQLPLELAIVDITHKEL
ncbi:MAG: DNA polymerase III subunit gamma/tau [Candidatus Nealsonbacteria bacterium]